MKRIIQTLIVVVVGVMVSLSTASAQSGDECPMCTPGTCTMESPEQAHGKMGKDQMGPRTMEFSEQAADNILKKLNLTAEQKDKLKANRKAQRDKMEDLQNKLKAKHKELENKLSDPNISRADVEPIVTELKSLQAKMMDCRLDGIFAVKEILTPEQFAKFQEKMKEKQEEMKEKVENRKEEWKEQRGRGYHEK